MIVANGLFRGTLWSKCDDGGGPNGILLRIASRDAKLRLCCAFHYIKGICHCPTRREYWELSVELTLDKVALQWPRPRCTAACPIVTNSRQQVTSSNSSQTRNSAPTLTICPWSLPQRPTTCRHWPRRAMHPEVPSAGMNRSITASSSASQSRARTRSAGSWSWIAKTRTQRQSRSRSRRCSIKSSSERKLCRKTWRPTRSSRSGKIRRGLRSYRM